jgi:hypothetical protein
MHAGIKLPSWVQRGQCSIRAVTPPERVRCSHPSIAVHAPKGRRPMVLGRTRLPDQPLDQSLMSQ